MQFLITFLFIILGYIELKCFILRQKVPVLTFRRVMKFSREIAALLLIICNTTIFSMRAIFPSKVCLVKKVDISYKAVCDISLL